MLYADDGTSQFYAQLYAQLRKAGTPIPTNDLWVAALAKQHDLTLFARDKHVNVVPGLPQL